MNTIANLLFKSVSNSTVVGKIINILKSSVTIGSFDLTTRHDLIMHLVGI